MNTYTLFFNNGETKLIYGNSLEDACENEYGETLCPLEATWKKNDCRKEYEFIKGEWQKIRQPEST